MQEYVDRLPEMADEIREMFPALVEVEQAEEDARGDARPRLLPPPRGCSQVGDYRILREVGRGGMGVVYEAEQVSLGRRVALKVLPGHVVGDRKALERFRREAKAAARLHHTNIVPVFEVGRDGDVAFYAMQFIQGQGLDQVIDELRRLRAGDRSTSARADRPGPSRRETRQAGTASRRTRPAEARARQVAESLLSGRLVRRMATAAIAARRSAATRPSGSTPTRPHARRCHDGPASRRLRCRPSSSTSAVLPGGTHGLGGRAPPAAGSRSSGAWRRSAVRRHRGWRTPTPAASSTATSSRRTCCWTPPGSSGSPTSAWPRPTTTA